MGWDLLLVVIALSSLVVSLGLLGHVVRLRKLIVHLSHEVEEYRERIEHLETLVKDLNRRLEVVEDLSIARARREATSTREVEQPRSVDDRYIDLKILALYQKGYSIRQIAKELGLSKSTVHRKLKKLLNT